MADDKENSAQSMGGKARAENLSSSKRKDIPRNAALARWADTPGKLPRETHEGIIEVLGITIACAVLEDGTRIFSTRGVNRALGSKQTGTPERGRSGAPKLPSILAWE